MMTSSNEFKIAFNKACEKVADEYKKKKNCNKSCPIFNSDTKCTLQCETTEFWEDRFKDEILKNVSEKQMNNSTPIHTRKQIKRKENGVYVCPTCGEVVIVINQYYCHWCGQELEW